jgi:putative addiction module component (TIGR02574 family)
MSDYESLLAGASALPVSVRIQSIEALWGTVPEDALPPISDEWLAEIERRTAEYEAGNEPAIPWEQVRREARLRAG